MSAPVKMTREEFDTIVAERVKECAGPIAAEMAKEAFAARIKEWEAENKPPSEAPKWFQKAMSVVSSGKTQEEVKAEKGQLAARMIRALASQRGDVEKAIAFSKKAWGDEKLAGLFEKALAAQDSTAGGFLVPEEVAAELIELLRPASVVRQFGPRVVPLDGGAMRMPKLTTGSTGGWIGENQNAPATQPAFGQIVLTPKKYASLVPISNDLLRRASAQADAVVRDDMVRDIRQATDLAYIRGSGVNGEPKGLRNAINASNIIPANGTVNLTNVTVDLGTMLQTLGDANVDMDSLGWMMEWRTWRYLITVRDTNNQFAFKPEMDNGTLFGFPFALTTQIPRNLGGGSDESELYLVNFSDVVIGDATSVLVDVSSEAAYHDGSNVVAAFSLDQTVIRAIFETDIQMRHDVAGVVLSAVTWGV